MLVIVDRSAPFVRSDAGRALLDRLRGEAAEIIEGGGPGPLLEQVLPLGERMHEVVCVGRASTTSVAVTAAIVGGADLSRLLVRHQGGGALDPWASTLGVGEATERGGLGSSGGSGPTTRTVLRVDDAGLPHAVFGLVFAAGASAAPISELLRGTDGRLSGLGRWMSESAWRDGGTDWRAEEWRCDGVPLESSATFVVSSLATIELGPLRLEGQAFEGFEVLSGRVPGGREALRWAAGGGAPWQRDRALRLEADTPCSWGLDGWTPATSGARSVRVGRGPALRFRT